MSVTAGTLAGQHNDWVIALSSTSPTNSYGQFQEQQHRLGQGEAEQSRTSPSPSTKGEENQHRSNHQQLSRDEVNGCVSATTLCNKRLHLPATREVAGSSPAVAHLTAKSPRRSSPDQGVGPLHSVESSRASCNSRCRKAGSRPDMATSPCLAPKTKMIVADWPKLKKKKKNKRLIQDRHVEQCVTPRPAEKSPAAQLRCTIATTGMDQRTRDGWLVGIIYFILLRQNEQALLPSCLDKWIVQAFTKRRRKERNIT